MLHHYCSPLLVQCQSNVYDADPTLIYHWVCWILCANTWHSNNAFSVLTHVHSVRRWPVRHWNNIGWLYRVFGMLHCADNALSSRRQKHQITRYIGPILMQCWATVCDARPTLSQPKPFKLLTTNIIVTIFFEHLLKTKVLNLNGHETLYCTCS